jgi:hypothetical protein
VGKLHYLDIMLQEALAYRSPVLDILLVTDKVQPLQTVVSSWQLPLNISYVEGVPDAGDKNRYWLTWVHRGAIAKAVKAKSYSTVLYMEVRLQLFALVQPRTATTDLVLCHSQDDTRMTWPTLVSWAIDTRVLAPWNFTRCFYRTEVDPQSGGFRLMDYRHGLDVVHNTTNMILDMATLDPARYTQQAHDLQKKSCGAHNNGQPVHCRVHRHFVAPDNPFQVRAAAPLQPLPCFTAVATSVPARTCRRFVGQQHCITTPLCVACRGCGSLHARSSHAS